jgi:hypothetical protein
MSDLISRATFDRNLELLRDPSLDPGRRATIVKQLIEEEDKLGKSQERLEFVESRAANGRELLNQSQARLNKSKHLASHAEAVRLHSNLKSIQHLLDHLCHQRRSMQNSGL